MENAWIVFGLPAPGGTERAIDRIAQGTVPTRDSDSTVTSGAGGQISSISRPASPGLQQAPLLGGSGSASSSEAAQPAVVGRRNNSTEMMDAADSQFTGLLVLTGCTVVRTSSILMTCFLL